MAKVVAVCVSAEKGMVKTPVEAAELRAGFGLVGDAHAGAGHRQVSLLGKESVDKMGEGFREKLVPGVFAENILTEGIALCELPLGTKLRAGTALLEITQIGKECHSACAIRRLVGDCVMPREGVFAVVLEGGTLRPGDSVDVEPPREEY